MPINYPNVPFTEINVRDRIRAKFGEYSAVVREQGNPGGARLQGERYEIAVAIHLYQHGRLTHGNQIGRWVEDGIMRHQEVKIGFNTEYDFALPGAATFPLLVGAIPAVGAIAGPLLGEAKSYNNGLGAYMKKATGYCLHDPTLGGFCFVTPGPQAATWRNMVGNAYEVLSNPQVTPGIAGGPGWMNRAAANGKPAGAAIVAHFQQYQPEAARMERQGRSVRTITTELAAHAGFVMVCLQVPNPSHAALTVMVRDL